MKSVLKTISILAMAFLISCGGDSKKKEDKQIKIGQKPQTEEKQEPVKTETQTAESNVDLSNKGIGPISSVDIPDDIDTSMASRGKEVFNNLCTACHKMEKKYIGPAIAGVSKRRSPEWVMNMILNPVEMIKKDPIAKQLLVESNMAVMANQNVSEEDARAILEYFREYDSKN
ncbi:MAG: c-type cytochrome [Bacteroidetes bacterium]|jgi:mono/diheme cytochrome c family protein|nr:c-type cytochrome [Bacteroidota bacterium]